MTSARGGDSSFKFRSSLFRFLDNPPPKAPSFLFAGEGGIGAAMLELGYLGGDDDRVSFSSVTGGVAFFPRAPSFRFTGSGCFGRRSGDGDFVFLMDAVRGAGRMGMSRSSSSAVSSSSGETVFDGSVFVSSRLGMTGDRDRLVWRRMGLGVRWTFGAGCQPECAVCKGGARFIPRILHLHCLFLQGRPPALATVSWYP